MNYGIAKRWKAAMCSLAILGLITSSQAVVTVLWEQDGANVTATWSGTLNIVNSTDTTRDDGNDFSVGAADALLIRVSGAGLGAYTNSFAGRPTDILTFDVGGAAGSSPLSFGFNDFIISWNDAHISGGSVGNVTELTFVANRDIITFANTDLASIGANSFNNTLAWTSDAATNNTISYTTVPEPSSLLLTSLGSLALLVRRKRC